MIVLCNFFGVLIEIGEIGVVFGKCFVDNFSVEVG